MKQGYTPGPWEAKDEEVYSVPAYKSVCMVLCSEGWEANARLIAAAPDLFEALEKAAEWFEDYACEHSARARITFDVREQRRREVRAETNANRAKQLRAALAKASTEEAKEIAVNNLRIEAPGKSYRFHHGAKENERG